MATPARKPKPPSLASVVHNYDHDSLQCRFPNHHWTFVSKARAIWDGRRVSVLRFECRCGNRRTWVIGAHGDIVDSSITYANKDYLLKGHGRVDRSVWRAEYVRRAWAQE